VAYKASETWPTDVHAYAYFRVVGAGTTIINVLNKRVEVVVPALASCRWDEVGAMRGRLRVQVKETYANVLHAADKPLPLIVNSTVGIARLPSTTVNKVVNGKVRVVHSVGKPRFDATHPDYPVALGASSPVVAKIRTPKGVVWVPAVFSVEKSKVSWINHPNAVANNRARPALTGNKLKYSAETSAWGPLRPGLTKVHVGGKDSGARGGKGGGGFYAVYGASAPKTGNASRNRRARRRAHEQANLLRDFYKDVESGVGAHFDGGRTAVPTFGPFYEVFNGAFRTSAGADVCDAYDKAVARDVSLPASAFGPRRNVHDRLSLWRQWGAAFASCGRVDADNSEVAAGKAALRAYNKARSAYKATRDLDDIVAPAKARLIDPTTVRHVPRRTFDDFGIPSGAVRAAKGIYVTDDESASDSE
jgi:hypothetical protein